MVFVSASAKHSEHDFVDHIVAAMEELLSLDFHAEREKWQHVPARMLASVMERFRRENPTTSLLVLLDEADSFIEAQIHEYRRRRESCLSFEMRSNIESAHDCTGLPRIRFLFSGYRTAHVREGAWVNWRRDLLLKPLAPKDAASLIAGPLARLGIDASDEASAVAYRCGYQPGVFSISARSWSSA